MTDPFKVGRLNTEHSLISATINSYKHGFSLNKEKKETCRQGLCYQHCGNASLSCEKCILELWCTSAMSIHLLLSFLFIHDPRTQHSVDSRTRILIFCSLLVLLTLWSCSLNTFKRSVCMHHDAVTAKLLRTLCGRQTRMKKDKVGRSHDPKCVQSEHQVQCEQLCTLTGSSCYQLLLNS